MATTTTTFSVLALEDAALEKLDADAPADPETGRRAYVRVRHDLGISSFGANAIYQAQAGTKVISEHNELGPAAKQHEELYVVVAGGATFTIDGEEAAAPQGTAVFVRDPAAKRSAIATEDGTIVLAIGGRPGEAWKPGPGEAIAEFYRLHGIKDYEGALAVCREGLEEFPGNAMIVYNVACCQNLLGNADEALEQLGEALAAWPDYKTLAADDEDFASLRGDARFQALIG